MRVHSCFLLQVSTVIWPFRAVAYLSPYRYGLNLLVYCAFIDASFEGTENCNSTQLVNNATGSESGFEPDRG